MTNKILPTLIILAIIIGSSCNTVQNDSEAGTNLDLLELSKSLNAEILKSYPGMTDSMISPLSMSNLIPQNREDLDKMRTVVRIFNGKDAGGISLPGFGGLKLGKDESSLNLYYVETKVVNNDNDSIVYGCGYSIHYLFKKIERGININNIPSVAASAQLHSNRTQVIYSIETYGITGKNLVKYFKPTVNKNFDVEGFGIMQSSIDGIHNILGDSILSQAVKFKPEILKFIKPYELEQ